MNTLVLTTLLIFSCAALVTITLTARSAYAWSAAVVLFFLSLYLAEQQAGWPIKQEPPDQSVVFAVNAGAVWALPPGSGIPRAYMLPRDLYEQALRVWANREASEEGELMMWNKGRGTETESQEGRPLLPLPDETEEKS